MNISAPFIRRPIGTSLLALGLFLAGAVAYGFLPVASLPSVDLPTIRVSASLPGADPATMAATVAAPLERHIGEIAGITQLTSRSTLGGTSIAAQFDLSRNADDAARDVQAAINAARVDLPSSFARNPTVRKSNPASTPIMILALTSTNLRKSQVYDVADLIVATRISQVEGVAEVTVGGGEQPAVRVQVDPRSLTAKGIGLEEVRSAIVDASTLAPAGQFDSPSQNVTVATNAQLTDPADYGAIVVKTVGGDVVRLRDIAKVSQATRNRLTGGWYNRQSSVILIVQKAANANVVATVARIRELLPEIRELIPAGIEVSVVVDRTATIQRSIFDLQLTLAASVILVMLVVLLFLRRPVPTLAAGIAVPLSLAGTIGMMWLAGFSLDNMSLLALTISVGFVVDDAIVMIETCAKNIEEGMQPYEAALAGARQIGFTVVSISLSLIAAFIPILFMGGITGRFIREFGMTLSFAIVISAVVSLTVTPMICGQLMRPARRNFLDRLIEPLLRRVTEAYGRSLSLALRHSWLMLALTAATLVFTVHLYMSSPKALLPQGDTGVLNGTVSGAADISFEAIADQMRQVTKIVAADPAVAGVGSFVGASGPYGSSNTGRFFVSLKPIEERQASVFEVIARLRQKLKSLGGADVAMYPSQEVSLGTLDTASQYQLTILTPNLDDLLLWVPRIVNRMRAIEGLIDVETGSQPGSAQAMVVVDRVKAASLGVQVRDVDAALNDAFSQRQVSTIYTDRNQYKVVLEVDQQLQRDMTAFSHIYIKSEQGQQVPLSAITRIETAAAPLVVDHLGQFPSITISFNLKDGTTLGDATQQITDVVGAMHLPDDMKPVFSGDAASLAQSRSSEPLLILAAIVSVYLVLGILYESLIHPITIISTLPSAGLGALLALQLSGTSLSLLTLIGILLLIGIVKKNGIMLVDFALEAERKHGASPMAAIHEACLERFRPITMTTLAALLGALPLILAAGPGSELRQPLGITIAGGLIVSQLLTIYTTPVIYLTLDRLRPVHWRKGRATDAIPQASASTM